MAGTVGILGSCQHPHKILVLQDCQAGDVHAVKTDIGVIFHFLGLAQQSDRHIEIIDIEVIERASAGCQIKGRGDIPLEVPVVAAGILAVIGLHHADAADFGEKLPHALDDPAVAVGHGLKKEASLFSGKIRQFLGMGCECREGLFHDDILARKESLPAVFVMNKIDDPHIDRVDVRVRQQFIVIRIDPADPEFLRESASFLNAVRAGKNGFELDCRHL